ncbi:phosphatase PAP2 family protein [Bacillus sp. AFS077874]|uniref:phosphatase PAP2 family protein n=2 Tax=Bacillaceae TaxID=186817 RepID=UPI000BEB3A03|nr:MULTISPECIES: phosphatase PAP2 family protein [unclassified Bacillus (in: firmicutes)]PEC48621.1 phosphatase PAP2 family protein [Bacillus sp. AFS096315]PFM82615.1 phosphatase PAP2 family protein [Bacillus sp. AFS077874]
MNLKYSLSIAFLISLLSLFGFGLMALLVSNHSIYHFDSTVINFIQGIESPVITSFMKIITFLGSSVFIILLSISILYFLYKVLNHRSELILFIAALIGSNILCVLLKLFFHRARPDLHRLIEISGYSFPSGHATNAMTVYGILTFILWRNIRTKSGRSLLIITSLIMILLIGISRIYLGVHFPSDVIAGYFTGGFWISTAIWYYQRYKERQYERKQCA